MSTACSLPCTSLLFALHQLDSLLFALHQLPDLKKSKGDVLVTGWGLGKDDEQATQIPVDWGAMTFALNSACKHKLAHMLDITLKPRGVFAGEVMVYSIVKGTAFDPDGKAELTPAAVADTFAALLDKRYGFFATIA
jgi:hypothetical protein